MPLGQETGHVNCTIFSVDNSGAQAGAGTAVMLAHTGSLSMPWVSQGPSLPESQGAVPAGAGDPGEAYCGSWVSGGAQSHHHFPPCPSGGNRLILGAAGPLHSRFPFTIP